ncbi:MAG: nicotinate-nicotinamide nucleotide adenylyltransferase, partial [Mariprofundaceae bacterium]|nr:nicotinate-nicotinamide nucleotide adenylyltransferase [Mariprofundaceae bacterium]
SAQRLAWIQRIFTDDSRVQVVDWEVMAEKPTPSIVTLRRFAREFPDDHAVLLLGADAFAGMDGWVEYPDHASLCDVAVFNRAGSAQTLAGTATAFDAVPMQQWLAEELQPQLAYGRRVDVEVALPDVSATGIRRMAVNKESLAGMVSECVRSEIEQAYAIVKA